VGSTRSFFAGLGLLGTRNAIILSDGAIAQRVRGIALP
jgi:hypothetical protein